MYWIVWLVFVVLLYCLLIVNKLVSRVWSDELGLHVLCLLWLLPAH